MSVSASGRPLVAMDRAQFAPMSRHWQDAWRATLADCVWLLIHTRPTSVGKYGEQAAILCDGRALRGWLPAPAGLSARAERRAAKAGRRAAKTERRAAKAGGRTAETKPNETVERRKTIAQYYAEMTRAPVPPTPEAFDVLIDDDLDEYEE